MAVYTGIMFEDVPLSLVIVLGMTRVRIVNAATRKSSLINMRKRPHGLIIFSN